jgi:succinoglycan biosynthesis protein ExoM
MQPLVVVGVCTCQRPKMLRVCLDSLAAQEVPAGFRLSLVVVDNESEPNNRPVVEAFRPASPFPVDYVHQPKRGIAAARNAIIDKAMALGADWIAMLDDDETADADWIAKLMAPDYLPVSVLSGCQIFVHPEPRPFWAPDDIELPGEGEELPTSTTANVRFNAALPRSGLRFDESFGLQGGEDREYFDRAHERGFDIRFTRRAITRETVHRSRSTYFGQMHRALWSAAADQRREILRKGRVRSARENALSIFKELMTGLWRLFWAILALPFGGRQFKRRALRGGRNIARVTGRAAALLGSMPEPYRQVVGH